MEQNAGHARPEPLDVRVLHQLRMDCKLTPNDIRRLADMDRPTAIWVLELLSRA